MEELMKLLAENCPDIDFAHETALIDGGVLDSLDIVMLVGELNDAFSVTITAEDLVPGNFNSAEAIWSLIQRLQAE